MAHTQSSVEVVNTELSTKVHSRLFFPSTDMAKAKAWRSYKKAKKHFVAGVAVNLT